MLISESHLPRRSVGCLRYQHLHTDWSLRCPFGTVTHTFASLITPCPDYGNDRERQHALALFLSRSFNAEFTAAQAQLSSPPLARLAPAGITGCALSWERGLHVPMRTGRKEGQPAGTLFEFVKAPYVHGRERVSCSAFKIRRRLH